LNKRIFLLFFVLIFSFNFILAACDFGQCEVGENCYNSGRIFEGKYCDFSGQMISLVVDGGSCLNDFECQTGRCLSGLCGDIDYSLEGELEVRGTLIDEIWAFMSGSECLSGQIKCESYIYYVCVAGVYVNYGNVPGQCDFPPEECGNEICDAGEVISCPDDCDPETVCGDSSCDDDENCGSCPDDCGLCPPPPFCGDDICAFGEVTSCPDDCDLETVCGDGMCTDGEETCTNCAVDCGACPVCGDGACNGGESCATCVADCGSCSSGSGSGGCNPRWECEVWSNVADQCGSRVCEDKKSCSKSYDRTRKDYKRVDYFECPNPYVGVCGNLICDLNENEFDCPGDCPPPGPECGDALCNGDETCSDCRTDCGDCTKELGGGYWWLFWLIFALIIAAVIGVIIYITLSRNKDESNALKNKSNSTSPPGKVLPSKNVSSVKKVSPPVNRAVVNRPISPVGQSAIPTREVTLSSLNKKSI